MRRNRLLVLFLVMILILIGVLATATTLSHLLGGIYWRLFEIRLNATLAVGALIGFIAGYFTSALRDRLHK